MILYAYRICLNYDDESQLFRNKTIEEKEKILPELVEFALKYGVKPAARKYFTYPSTIRIWVKKYNELGLAGLKFKNNSN